MFLGKLFVAAATGIIGYLLITRVDSINSQLNSPILPTVVKFIHLILGNDIRRMGHWSYLYGNIWYGSRYLPSLFPR
jgi:hypothetical protein